MLKEKWNGKSPAGRRSSAGSKHLPRKVWWALGLFVSGLVLAAGEGFFGTYPFGLAALSAVSGLIGTTAVFLGSLTGSFTAGGILPIATLLLFALRTGITLWLAADRRDSFPGGSGHSPSRLRQILRHSRTSGWLPVGWLRHILSPILPASPPPLPREDTDLSPESSPAPEASFPLLDGIRRTVHTGSVIRTGKPPDTGQHRTDTGSVLTWADRNLYHEHIGIRMGLGALSVLFTGGWALVRGGYVPYDLLGMLVGLAAVPVLVFLFYAATDRRMRTSAFRDAGILASLAALTCALSTLELPLFDFHFGQAFALAAAILTGSSYGAARGMAVGLACGILLSPLYAPAYALAGGITGIFAAPFGGIGAGETLFALGQAGSRTLGLFAGATSATVWAIYAGGLKGIQTLVPEILICTAVFLPFFSGNILRLPDHWCGILPDTRRSERTAVAEMVLAGREKKLTALGSGMTSLGEMLGSVSEKLIRPSHREMRDLAESCFAVYCDRCPIREKCHHDKNAAEWDRMLGRMAQSLTEEGGVCAVDVPANFASRCGAVGRVLDEINSTAAHRMRQRRSGDRLRVAAEDYTHMGRLLAESARLEEEEGTPDPEMTGRLERLLSCSDFAAGSVSVYGTRHKRIFVHDIDLTGTRLGGEEIAALFRQAVGMPLSVPQFSIDGALLSMEMHTLAGSRCEVGRCTRAASELTGEENGPSGDTVCAFTGDGKQYMLLSDGMGTGRMAALTSGMAAVFLERMLAAGATLETALKMLNNVIRAGCDECAATVDLCEVDLVTGEARFIKSGAAPSFVIRKGSLFRLQSKTVPIGILRALDAEMIRFTVEPGDVIVMLSDGIARSFEECPWLLDLLSTDPDITEGRVQPAAETIVAEAAARGARDDITAGVMLICSA